MAKECTNCNTTPCKCGRPTKYTETTVDEALHYIETFEDDDDDVVPTYEGLSLRLGVCVATIENWGNQHKPFLGALKALKGKQKKILINMGLTGDFNSTIAKLILSSNHGINEKTEVDNNINVAPQIFDDMRDKK